MKPIKFEPLLKSILWGGDKIIPFKGLDIKMPTVGESWEISGVKGNVSIIADGVFILIMAEVFSIGLKLKEEHDLTI